MYLGKYTKVPGSYHLHPGRLTWNLKMMVWKMIFLFNWVIVRFQPLIFRGVEAVSMNDVFCWLFWGLYLEVWRLVAGSCHHLFETFWVLLDTGPPWGGNHRKWEVDQNSGWWLNFLKGWFWVKVTDIKKGWRITSSLFFGNLAAWHSLSCFFFRTSTRVDIEDDTFLDSLRVLACEESCEGAQCPLKTHSWTSVKKWWLRFCVPSGKLT